MHAFETDKQDRLPLLLGQKGDRAFKIAQFERDYRGGGNGKNRSQLIDRAFGPFTQGAAQVVDVLVMKNGKKPGPQIGTGLPQMLLGDRAQKAILHQIVGADSISGKGARITAQTRDFPFEKPTKFVHRA